MKFFEVCLPDGRSQICTEQATTELPSLWEFVRDSRADDLIGKDELPQVLCEGVCLNNESIEQILRETKY